MSDKAIEHATDRCTAKTAASGFTVRCAARSVKGATVCFKHGGVLPNVKSAAQVRLARDKAQQEALSRLKGAGASRQDTITEMDRLAAEVIVFKDVCGEMVTRLLAAGEEFGYESKAGEQIRAAVTVYERALDRCNTVLATNVKLGIAERKAKLDEAEALLVAGVIRAILGRLNLTADQKVIAGQVVPEELRAISAAVSQ